jgi:hypothetical protein
LAYRRGSTLLTVFVRPKPGGIDKETSVRKRSRLTAGIGALAAVVTAVMAVPRPAEAAIDTDTVKLTDNDIDFGNDTFIAGAPLGSGSVEWDIVSGFYTPRLTGTLHLDGASGQYARMHISYWDGGGGYIDTRHGGIVQAPDNGHHDWSVDLSPLNLAQITEVHVCTEISNNGVNFTQVDCKTRYLY